MNHFSKLTFDLQVKEGHKLKKYVFLIPRTHVIAICLSENTIFTGLNEHLEKQQHIHVKER